MSNTTKTCRVCHKTYPACENMINNKAFRWKNVVCSEECWTEYLHKIQVSRGVESSNPVTYPTMYNEDINGFDQEVDEEYEFGFGDED